MNYSRMKKQIQNVTLEKIFAIPSRQMVPYTLPVLIKQTDFFNKLSKIEPASLDEVTRYFNFDKRVLDAVLSYLQKEGFIEKTGSKKKNKYKLSLLAREHLLQNAKYDLSKFALIIDGSVPDKMGNSIISALKTGKPAEWSNAETWKGGMTSGLISKTFSEGVMSRGKVLADSLSTSLKNILPKYTNLIDIGGSLGDYCGQFTADFWKLSCTVFDLPKVIENTKENIKKMNYRGVDTIAGDMFKDDLPKNFDVHFYSNTLHDWNPDQITKLLKKSHKSLNADGAVIIHDLHLNNDKKSPSFAVDHSLFLAVTTEGRCYSYAEIADLLKNAGFKKIHSTETCAGYGVIVGYKK